MRQTSSPQPQTQESPGKMFQFTQVDDRKHEIERSPTKVEVSKALRLKHAQTLSPADAVTVANELHEIKETKEMLNDNYRKLVRGRSMTLGESQHELIEDYGDIMPVLTEAQLKELFQARCSDL